MPDGENSGNLSKNVDSQGHICDIFSVKNWRVILENEMHILFLWINALLTTFSQKDRTVNEFNLTDRIS